MYRSIPILIIICLQLQFPLLANAQVNNSATLKRHLTKIIATSNGKVGVAVQGIDFKASLLINNSHRYPMQSVYKFPLALYILHLADQHAISLDQSVTVTRANLDSGTWSPMLKDFTGNYFKMTVAELLRYSVGKSDNNACDLLFELAKGTTPVNAYVHNLGADSISIAATERAMKAHWRVQYTNWCQPAAMARLLVKFYEGKLLSKEKTALLLRIMTASENSAERIKGDLPEGTPVAHKTGTSGISPKGIAAAVNDAGIITLPDGKHLALVVFISDAPSGIHHNEQLIARISRVIYDYYATL